MILPEVPPTGARWRAYALLVISTLLLVTALVLVHATTTTGAPAFTNSQMAPVDKNTPALTSNPVAFISDPSPSCGGNKPGICPGVPFTQSN